MKYTKEQLEKANKQLDEAMEMCADYIGCRCDVDDCDAGDCWPCRFMSVIEMLGYTKETIQSLIQDALDPWNYNMDEAPSIPPCNYDGSMATLEETNEESDLPSVNEVGVASKITKENE